MRPSNTSIQGGRGQALENQRALLLPGLYDSSPDHWQSLWERDYPSWRRVCQSKLDISPLCRLGSGLTGGHRDL